MHLVIIIIIWHYNPLWVFAFSAKSLQVLLSLAISFQFLTFSFFRSSITSSCHRCLGLPTGLIPIGFQSGSFLTGLAWSILWICPSHLILCALMHLTISAPSINISISMLFRILHILSVLTGPNIFLSILVHSVQMPIFVGSHLQSLSLYNYCQLLNVLSMASCAEILWRDYYECISRILEMHS